MVTTTCRRCRAPVGRDDRYCPSCGTRQPTPLAGPAAPPGGAAPGRPAALAPGWHPDPFGRSAHRWFDGDIWTEHTFDRQPGRDPLVLDRPAAAAPPSFRGRNGTRLALTAGGLVVAFALSFLVALADIGLSRPGGELVLLVVSELGLWSGLLGTCLLVSRRYGSGRLRTDYDLRFRWVDLGIGALGALVGRCVAAALVLPFVFARGNLGNPDRGIFGSVTPDGTVLLVLALVVCVGAPFFEELFFRGLLQGQLVARLGPAAGVGLTALVFGAAHIANDPGVAGCIYGLSIAGGGVVLGVVRQYVGRLGASMATHALFNGAAMAALVALVNH